ncbi:MAG TPA: GNAT family N-acetyltransferase [Caulobacteraceae bacterium]|nr:GNAT family N-acetyltransferase [Caulobacteraceae bacterium]
MRKSVPGVRLEAVTGELPAGFKDLRAEARVEGHRFVDRLAEGWAERTMRFDGRGERLLAGFVGCELAGIGGLTIEPAVPNALRMRRFYIRPSHRRTGVGRQLALALLDRCTGVADVVTVNAQEASFPFWESLGFVREARDGFTHTLDLSRERLDLAGS